MDIVVFKSDKHRNLFRFIGILGRILYRHIFLAVLADERRREIKEPDWQQQNSLWVPLEEADALNFRPANLTGKISSLISGEHAQYLGCCRFVNL